MDGIELFGLCDFTEQFLFFRTAEIILFIDVISLPVKKFLCSMWMGIMKSNLNLVWFVSGFYYTKNKMVKAVDYFLNNLFPQRSHLSTYTSKISSHYFCSIVFKKIILYVSDIPGHLVQ